jgi:putative membrane protein
MSERSKSRRPAAFRLDDPGVIVAEAAPDNDYPTRASVRVIPEDEAAALPVPVERPAPVRRGWRWGTLFWSALGGLVALGASLAVAQLVEELFARNDALGFLGLGLALIAALAFVVIVARETYGLLRLATIEKLHRRAEEAVASDERALGRAVADDLVSLLKGVPQLARGRANVASHLDDIIDGADMVRLAEREMMSPLDREAVRLVSAAAKRVSVVTAVSPRALIDMGFVLITTLGLVRRLALLYGGRPGTLGMIRLLRLSIAHLAVTGGLAAGDSLIHQMFGHGIAAKLSAKLGEGVLNGLLTARLGLAAIEVTRPLPFNALPRPAMGTVAGDLLKSVRGSE